MLGLATAPAPDPFAAPPQIPLRTEPVAAPPEAMSDLDVLIALDDSGAGYERPATPAPPSPIAHPAIALGPKATIEVVGDLRRRPEGVRVRHRAGANSVKMYDKQGSILRIETTLNDIRDFREKRTIPATGKVQWRALRKGVVALRRRAEVSQAVNNRYANALAAANTETTVGELITEVTRPVFRRSQRHRALNPWAPQDALLLKTIARGDFLTNGLRNRDLRAVLYTHLKTPADIRKASAAVSRRLALLKAHGLIQKVPGSHRYQLTSRGHQITAAILNLYPLSLQDVLKHVA